MSEELTSADILAPLACPACDAPATDKFYDRDGRPWIFYYQCGASWDADTLAPLHFINVCPKSMQLAVAARTAPTPPTTPAAAARDALIAAFFAERKAWQKLAALTVGDDASADACLLACQERDAAAEVLDDAAIAYLAAQEPTP